MKETTCDNTRRGHTLIAVLGITAFALLMLDIGKRDMYGNQIL